jgi:hypothetical protein
MVNASWINRSEPWGYYFCWWNRWCCYVDNRDPSRRMFPIRFQGFHLLICMLNRSLNLGYSPHQQEHTRVLSTVRVRLLPPTVLVLCGEDWVLLWLGLSQQMLQHLCVFLVIILSYAEISPITVGCRGCQERHGQIFLSV